MSNLRNKNKNVNKEADDPKEISFPINSKAIELLTLLRG
jgi:hypothetical protein